MSRNWTDLPEHGEITSPGRAPDAGVAHWQDRLTPLWPPLAGGCHLDRDLPALIRAGGFAIEELSADCLSWPRVLT